MIQTLKVLGVSVHLAQMNQVLEVIDEWIRSGMYGRYIVATGMHGLVESRRDSRLLDVFAGAGLFVPDGFSLVALARMKGYDIKKRVSGPDLMWQACEHAEKKGYRVFFYGDTEGTLSSLLDRVRRDLPKLQVAGTFSPPFRDLTPSEDSEIIEMLNNSRTDILWVGLGLPKQERWIFDHKDYLNIPVSVGVGAAFKFCSGKVRRAPSWIGDNGFEWLWRLIFEPRRVWKRVLIDAPYFVFCLVKESIDSAGLIKRK